MQVRDNTGFYNVVIFALFNCMRFVWNFAYFTVINHEHANKLTFTYFIVVSYEPANK